MQTLSPQLTEDLKRHVGVQPVFRADPFPIENYRQLVEHVARLAYVNGNHLFFSVGKTRTIATKPVRPRFILPFIGATKSSKLSSNSVFVSLKLHRRR